MFLERFTPMYSLKKMIEYTGVCLKANSPCIQSFSEAIDICETITKIHKYKIQIQAAILKRN